MSVLTVHRVGRAGVSHLVGWSIRGAILCPRLYKGAVLAPWKWLLCAASRSTKLKVLAHAGWIFLVAVRLLSRHWSLCWIGVETWMGSEVESDLSVFQVSI